jgi:hypothetical protein
MNKSKVNVKSNYKIKSVTKELKLKENKYEPYDYILYKVTSPNKDVKYFSSRKDATEYVKGLTNNKMNIVDAFKEIKRLNDMKLPIKTI